MTGRLGLRTNNIESYPQGLQERAKKIQTLFEEAVIPRTLKPAERWSNLVAFATTATDTLKDYLIHDREKPSKKQELDDTVSFLCYSYQKIKKPQATRRNIRKKIELAINVCYGNPDSQHYNRERAIELKNWLDNLSPQKRNPRSVCAQKPQPSS